MTKALKIYFGFKKSEIVFFTFSGNISSWYAHIIVSFDLNLRFVCLLIDFDIGDCKVVFGNFLTLIILATLYMLNFIATNVACGICFRIGTVNFCFY